MSKGIIGKEAFIKANAKSFHAGGWGVIVGRDLNGEYHIAMYGDKNDCCVFERNEFVVHR